MRRLNMKAPRRWHRRTECASALLAVTITITGCSVLIANSGSKYPLVAVDQGVTRAEVHDRLGSPTASGTCPDGRPFDRYKIRQPFTRDWTDWTYGPGSLYAIMFEPILTPIAAVISEAKKIPITVVYGLDHRVLYGFIDTDGSRSYQVTGSLSDGIRTNLSETDSSTWVPQVSAYIAELRQRVACTGTTLSGGEEARLDQLIQTVQEGAWGMATTEDALDKLSRIDFP